MLTLCIGVMRKSPAFKGNELFIKNEKSFITKAYAYFPSYLQKYLFITFFPSAPIFGHLLLCENLKAGFAEKVFSTSATRRQSEAVYEYCALKPTK